MGRSPRLSGRIPIYSSELLTANPRSASRIGLILFGRTGHVPIRPYRRRKQDFNTRGEDTSFTTCKQVLSTPYRVLSRRRRNLPYGCLPTLETIVYGVRSANKLFEYVLKRHSRPKNPESTRLKTPAEGISGASAQGCLFLWNQLIQAIAERRARLLVH